MSHRRLMQHQARGHMATITIFNPKGGSGKSTTALILATELAASGASVAVLDGDPNPNLYNWADRRGMPTIDAAVTPADSTEEALRLMETKFGEARFAAVRCQDSIAVPDWLDALSRRFAFVVADPEGTANDWVNHAAAMSDLVIVPLRASPMDAEQMVRAVRLVRSQSKALRREIPYRLLFTCAGLPTKDERMIREHAAGKGHPIMKTTLAERAAYRAMLSRQATLGELPTSGDEKISGLDKARKNAAELVEETILTLGIREAAE